MENAKERIDMINSFELIGRSRNEKVDMHLQSNFYILMINSIAFSITIIIILLTIINEIFGIEAKFNWNKTSLILIISINLYIAIGIGIYKKLILKHLKYLETSAANFFDQQFNDELALLLTKLNKPLKNNLMIVILMVIVFIGSITDMYMNSQFINFNLFIVPTLLLYLLATLNIWNNYKKLKANICKVENSYINNKVENQKHRLLNNTT